MTIDQYLFNIKRCFENNEPLLNFLSMNLKTATYIGPLQQEIQQLTVKQVSQKVEKLDLPSASMESLVESYVMFVRDVDPWFLLNSIDLMIDVFHFFSIALNTKSTQHLNSLLPVLYEYMDILVPLAKLVDEESMKIKNWVNAYPRLSYISNDLLKCLNNIRSDPEINQISNKFKIKVLFDVCIKLCNIYFSIGKHILCNNVFSNINVLNLDLNLISKSQILRYRYIVGKFYSQQASYTKAFHHLDWCYSNLPPSTKFMNHIKILKYLLPIGLLVGKVPSTQYLQGLIKSSVADPNGQAGRYFLNSMLPFITAYKKGDLEKVMIIINRNEDLWKSLGLWIGMVQRIRILVLRNLLARCYQINGQPLSVQTVQICVQASIGTCNLQEIYHMCDSVDLNTAENLLATLSFSGLMKGKTSGTGIVVMSKGKAFPPVQEVYLGNTSLDTKEKWLNK